MSDGDDDAPLELDPERPVIATCHYCRAPTTHPQKIPGERRKRTPWCCPACCIERGYPITD